MYKKNDKRYLYHLVNSYLENKIGRDRKYKENRYRRNFPTGKPGTTS